MSKQSAGILLYRILNNTPEVFLVHPGGPLWAKKETNAWSVPKGEFTDEESSYNAAIREFEEETGLRINCKMTELSPVRQKSGKTVFCFTCHGEIDPGNITSNTFEMEWPPRSGRKQIFPEVDRAGWFDFSSARTKILEYQLPLLDELEKLISGNNIA